MIKSFVIILIGHHIGTSTAVLQKNSWHKIVLDDGIPEAKYLQPGMMNELQCANSASKAAMYCHHGNGTCFHAKTSLPFRLGDMGNGWSCKKLGAVIFWLLSIQKTYHHSTNT